MVRSEESKRGLELLREGLRLQQVAIKRARIHGRNETDAGHAARDTLAEAATTLGRDDSLPSAALAYAHLSGAELWCGNLDDARSAAKRGLGLAEQSGATDARAEALGRLAEIARAEARSIVEIDSAYEDAAAAWRAADNTAREGLALSALAAYQLETGREPRAKRTARLARCALSEAGESVAARNLERMLRVPWISRILRRL